MSTQGRVGVSVQSPAEIPLDQGAARLRRLEQKSDASPTRDAISIGGTVDTTRPQGSILTDGITLGASASVNVPHNLGRAAVGFIPIVTGGPTGVLQNDTASLKPDMQAKFVRVTNTGGSTVTFKLQVL
jgi:hypothetical protein